ncbi:ergothioneine biosynthesis glutamate--cysteine ligase EgtA [Micromonospora sp. WMMD1102]|uniref:ergothioneine biosynthesis glutamate--cysteine ligase EgtA n=1 Tax=Micromonospora sp. WMMD1102 TaxID=3016105 RepID=UPI002414E458|nr:ergothioneine biosynthesis glutamate--cysteine ligase EgtA [Micromonospora sp. WMMD1102]MDG4787397.1 ergothioneine biosynthesis glutamate--cysteine ligase EgtA [Micromonospora sp. WMMD1102]
MPSDLDSGTILRAMEDAEGYVAKICFKTGPPALTGVELEWTVHDAAVPSRPLDPVRLRTALGPYAPTTLDQHSPAQPLPRSGTVSVEPGGQVEISTAPRRSLGELHESASSDLAHLTELLGTAGLVTGATGIDPHRPPTPVVDTPRYRAMRCAFDRLGAAGRTMMYSTAGLQVCLDAGTAADFAGRWAAAHAFGPPLLAAFGTARRHAGRDTGWASARMAAWQFIDPARTRPAWSPASSSTDPVGAWVRYALAAPLLCVRRDGADWTVPPGITFRDWLAGALPRPPTTDDLDYHLSTLFPPVRPRGYLEIRYLDAQPGPEWIAPVGVLAALLGDDRTRDAAQAACEPVAGRWWNAARHGLRDPLLAGAADTLLDLALRSLDRTGLPPATREEITRIVARRLAAARKGST